ncbi:MAG: HAMP domain-containing sensor histidine kinase [Polyangiales bacterium]
MTDRSTMDAQTVLRALDHAGVAFAVFDERVEKTAASEGWGVALDMPTQSDKSAARARIRHAVERAFAGESVDERCEFGEGDSVRSLRLRAVSVRDGASASAVVWLSDLSDAARANAKARDHAARAAKAEAVKDQFLATLSHELRTPLATILGWTQLLRGRTPDAATVDGAVATIDRAARAQLRLIDDILVAARVVAGALLLERRRVDLARAVSRATDAVRASAEQKDVQIDVRLTEGCFVDGDAGRIEHVAFHLLGNAVKFSARGGHVSVAVDRDDELGSATIAVRDEGIGIAPELLPRVFERFTQGETGLTRAHGGLGLGLSLARHLVEAHGGSIHVESDGKGRGTTVLVRMPLAS